MPAIEYLEIRYLQNILILMLSGIKIYPFTVLTAC